MERNVQNICSVCHTGCSYRTWWRGLGSSQFSTHCMSYAVMSDGVLDDRLGGSLAHLPFAPKRVARALSNDGWTD